MRDPIPATDPFTSLSVHFGMLLGVADLERVVGHAWAKIRLHHAWWNGQGVVWGFGIAVDEDSREVRISPGLAVDAAGHELYLPEVSCLDLAAWYREHEDETVTRCVRGGVVFDAHVVARFSTCPSRPVPALVSPCEGEASETAFSRLGEHVELFLVPGRSSRTVEYPRLRRLFGLPCTGDDELDDRVAAYVDPLLARIEATDDRRRPALWLKAVRACAAHDTAERRPAGLKHRGGSPLFPADEPADVVLGDLLGVSLITSGDVTTAYVETIDIGTRWSHVDTATLVELASAGAIPGGRA